MYIIQHVLLSLGGITLFLLGLKIMSENMEKITGEKMKSLLSSCTKNKLLGVLTGTISTGVIQSSIATNIIVVGFVSSGILTFYQASAIIMGANIGTTITAQLVSLSGKEFFDITAFGSLIFFVGFMLSFFKNKKTKYVGNIMEGFGMLFLGLDIVNESVIFFKNFEEFRRVFLVKNDLLLLLNGILITAIVQSSSAVTSVMIILAGNSLLSFENSMFLILGANIGTCFSVIVASMNKNLPARQTAIFNLAFNVFGSLILVIPLMLFKSQIANLFAYFSSGIERQIANFHTLFNLFVTIILLPFLKPFTTLIEKATTTKKVKRANELPKKAIKVNI